MKKSKNRNKTNLDISTQLEFAFKGVNLRSRIITISDEIDHRLFLRIDAAMTELEHRGDKPITVRINSPGGFVYSALAIVGRLTSSKCKIITEGYGHVMSAATLILACGNVRRISKFAWFMVHEMSYESSGKHSDHKNTVAQAEREEEQWSNAMASFTRADATFWRTVCQKDTYFNAKELVKHGCAEQVI